MQAQILLMGVGALLVVLLGVWLLEKLLSKSTGGGAGAEMFLVGFVLVAWILASLKLWFDWRVKRYEIGPNDLVVHTKAGWFGSVQNIYRYESVISIRMTQGFLGKSFGYGDIRLSIPKLPDEVVLNDIEDPIHQLAELQHRMGAQATYGAAGTTAALVS